MVSDRPLEEHVAVLGGGLSGLVAAWALARRGAKVTVFEKAPRLGGWVQTDTSSGFLFEEGPRGFRPKGKGQVTLELVKALGLDNRLIAADAASRKRFLYVRGRLEALPPLWAFWRSFATRSVPWACCKDWVTGKVPEGQEETIDAFARRRFGGHVADYLLDPLVRGIFAGDARRLSLSACFPVLAKREKEHGSLLKSLLPWHRERQVVPSWQEPWQKETLLSFRGGMCRLIEALHGQTEATWHTSSPVEGIVPTKEGINIQSAGREFSFDRVVSTLSSAALSPLVAASMPEAIPHLAPMESASLVLLQIGYHTPVVRREGFGYLVPTKEACSHLLGMEWDSSVFPMHNRHSGETRLALMLGGAQHPEVLLWSDEKLFEEGRKVLREHLGVSTPPAHMSVVRVPAAIPQYVLGHAKRVQAMKNIVENYTSRLSLLGMSFHGVAVNDTVDYAIKTIEGIEHPLRGHNDVCN